MTTKLAFYGVLLIIGFAAGQLIEVDDSKTHSNNRRENVGSSTDMPLFNPPEVDSEEGGLEITGPINPNEPGLKLDNDVEIESSTLSPNDMLENDVVTEKTEDKDKVIDDPWRQFYDPDYTNPFGQRFPSPEDYPQVPKRPAIQPNKPEPASPIGDHNNQDIDEKLGEFLHQGHNVPNHGGYVSTQRPTHGTFEPYPEDPQTYKPYPTRPSNSGHSYVPNQPNNNHKPYYPQQPSHYPQQSSHYPEQPSRYPHQPYYPQQPQPQSTDEGKDKYYPGLGGILGWGKQATTKPHHSILGNILGGLKDKNQHNLEAIGKAKQSVAQASQQVVEAGRDVFGAIWTVGNSFNPLSHKNKVEKHPSLFGGLFRRGNLNVQVPDEVNGDVEKIEAARE